MDKSSSQISDFIIESMLYTATPLSEAKIAEQNSTAPIPNYEFSASHNLAIKKLFKKQKNYSVKKRLLLFVAVMLICLASVATVNAVRKSTLNISISNGNTEIFVK